MNYLIIPAYQPDLNLVKLVRLVHAKSDLHIIVVALESGGHGLPHSYGR